MLDEIRNFSGELDRYEFEEKALVLRFADYDCPGEGPRKPILRITLSEIDETDALKRTLEDLSQREIDGIEVEGETLKVWTVDQEDPTAVVGTALSVTWGELEIEDYEKILKRQRWWSDYQARSLTDAKQRIATTLQFIEELERRIKIKAKGHQDASAVTRRYREELDLLSRIHEKLSGD